MPAQPPKTDYSIQAVVIPRCYDPEEKKLHVCLAFGVVQPDNPADVTIPRVLEEWPALIHKWLWTAKLRIVGATAHRFERWWPLDMYGWKVEDSQKAWSALFKGVVDFGEADRQAQTGKAVDQFRKVYSEPHPNIVVNPASASDLNPANRIEAPNPIAISEGLAAEHFRRIRENNALVRAELDARYVAALGPNRLRDSVTAFVREIRRERERYGHVVAAALPALIGLVAQETPSPQDLMGALPQKHRHEILGEFVAFELQEKTRTAAQEYLRIERQIQSARNREPVDRKQVKEDLRKPTFQQLIARVRQYPGLARRLSLTVHGAIGLPPDMPKEGRIKLEWNDSAKEAINWKTPSTSFYFNKDGVFRPKPEFDEFAPKQLDLFYRSHVFDRQLYRVTQQDMIQAAARSEADRMESPVKPVSAAEALDPPRQSFPDLEAEVKRHQSNAVLFVTAPQVPDLPDPVTSAHAIHRRLQQSQNLIDHEGVLHAEDLMVGVTVFARPARSGGRLPWYSLCRRIVHVEKQRRAVLAPFEEEGFIATGTNLLPPPQVGLVKQTEPERNALLKMPAVDRFSDGTLIRRQHSQIYIGRLLPDNKIVKKNLELTLARPARYHGHFHAFVTADDVYENDIIRATLGGGAEYTDIEVVPLLTLDEEKPPKEPPPVIRAKGATKQRADQRFAIGLFDRTKYLNPEGKVLKDDKDPDKKSCDVFWDELKKKPQFFVEGVRRIQLMGPKISSSLLYEIQPNKVSTLPVNDAIVAIHKSIPPAVLRPQHLWAGDEYWPLPFARPTVTGVKEDKDISPADVREIATPLTHVRGTVVAIDFELNATLIRTRRGVKPQQTFINIGGQPWEFQFNGQLVELDKQKADQLSCPFIIRPKWRKIPCAPVTSRLACSSWLSLRRVRKPNQSRSASSCSVEKPRTA